MKKLFSIAFVLIFTLATFAQTAPQASPTPIKADKPAAKEFKAELTPEESALLRPVIDEFNKWSAKLAAASDMLDKSDAAASPEVEGLQLQLAAKDIRTARKELKRVQGEFVKWEAEIKKNHDCADCRFDEATGKLVKTAKPDR
ncbi:MAG TPA: hypothetical protein PLD20_26870 [Blastocatellia bacterium]|nr:hypothetical protein [Blastocatellia bacterium]HMY74190.1 hypothetical protein [Blastocatellia bacterium]HMZ21586.1 hypothetical protein [Blastocatellia bacterium]